MKPAIRIRDDLQLIYDWIPSGSRVLDLGCADGELLVCPECAHEWTVDATNENGGDEKIVKDSNGNVLASGDTVILIKDLKVKGSYKKMKKGTKVKNIRLVDGEDMIHTGV